MEGGGVAVSPGGVLRTPPLPLAISLGCEMLGIAVVPGRPPRPAGKGLAAPPMRHLRRVARAREQIARRRSCGSCGSVSRSDLRETERRHPGKPSVLFVSPGRNHPGGALLANGAPPMRERAHE